MCSLTIFTHTSSPFLRISVSKAASYPWEIQKVGYYTSSHRLRAVETHLTRHLAGLFGPALALVEQLRDPVPVCGSELDDRLGEEEFRLERGLRDDGVLCQGLLDGQVGRMSGDGHRVEAQREPVLMRGELRGTAVKACVRVVRRAPVSRVCLSSSSKSPASTVGGVVDARETLTAHHQVSTRSPAFSHGGLQMPTSSTRRNNSIYSAAPTFPCERCPTALLITRLTLLRLESATPLATMAGAAWPPELSEEHEQHVLDHAADWALAHGLVLRPLDASTTSGIHAPYSLYPSPFPRHLFDEARRLQPLYNDLYARITADDAFLEQVVGGAVSKVDEFQGRLYEVWKQVKQEGVKQVSETSAFSVHNR